MEDKIINVYPDGRLQYEGMNFRCALGKGGVTYSKMEGDGKSPVGVFPLRAIYYRADRLALPEVQLPVIVINPAMGWCDEPESPHYNRLIVLPTDWRHEEMWREDACYDVVVEIGYNDEPPVFDKGSAIFMHVAKEGYQPTEGCVALAKEELLKLLPRLTPETKIHIHAATE